MNNGHGYYGVLEKRTEGPNQKQEESLMRPSIPQTTLYLMAIHLLLLVYMPVSPISQYRCKQHLSQL